MGQRPIRPFGIVDQEIDQDVGIDQRHPTSPPRSSAMISSVDMPPRPWWPRGLASLLGCGPVASAFSITMLPSAARRNAIWLPGTIPKWSRTGFGIVTWPLLVTVVAIAALPE